MTSFFKLFFDFIAGLIDLLNRQLTFEFFGYEVSWWSIVVAFLMIYMVASVYWRGARG